MILDMQFKIFMIRMKECPEKADVILDEFRAYCYCFIEEKINETNELKSNQKTF